MSSTDPSWRNRMVVVLGTCVLILAPFALLVLVELLLYSCYRVSGSRYCESVRESGERIGYRTPIRSDLRTYVDEINSPKKKIAVFGGSSAAGYASSVGFTDLIKVSLGEQYVVHNYAQPGAPFVGFEDKLIALVADRYDVILVYAGHNEIWSYLYRKALSENRPIQLPTGDFLEPEAARTALADIDHYAELLRLAKDFAAAEGLSKLRVWAVMEASQLGLRSRLVNLIRRGMSWIRPPPASHKVPHFLADTVVPIQVRPQIGSDFVSSIRQLALTMRPGQRLIVSTVLVNDLYPPSADVWAGSESERVQLETLVARAYRQVFSDRLDSAVDLSILPYGSHRWYLEAAKCVDAPLMAPGTSVSMECETMFRKARDLDALPFRAVSYVNEGLRAAINFDSRLLVADAERRAMKRRAVDSLSMFVDFQHPSAVGHALIAEVLLEKLSPESRVVLRVTNECDTVQADGSMGTRVLSPTRAQMQRAFRTNSAWLESFASTYSSPFMHQHYLESVRQKIQSCAP